MAAECFPAVTRCFSGKTPKEEATRCFSSKTLKADRRSSSSRSVSDRRSSSSHSEAASPPPKRPWEEEMREVFRHFDVDADGKISAAELRAYFTSVGELISHDDAQSVIDDLDSDGDGLLGFGDFLRLMEGAGKGHGGDGGEEEDDLKKVFEMFEHEKGSGRITPRGLQRMLGRLGESKSHDQCAAMIQIYDVDGDGELDFQEFYEMMS